MIIIVYSETNRATVETNLGAPEYSYFFVLKEFLPWLEKLGTVIQTTEPNSEVDKIYFDAVRRKEDCVFLSFSPPHRTPLGLACPTIPVFAWEFDTIPTETWFAERCQDWRVALSSLGRAVTHSNFAVAAVKGTMGPDFPIVSIPAPIWDRCADIQTGPNSPFNLNRERINAEGDVVDTRNFEWVYEDSLKTLRPPGNANSWEVDRRAATVIELGGVVYTSILNPFDGRKNLIDMLRGFVWAFRDVDDAVLVLKLVSNKSRSAIKRIMHELHRFTPFKCRVVLIDSYLSDDDYRRLLLATTYALNASSGEGQCLPLMEYMSAGKPAVAPCHTALEDYISVNNAFVVEAAIRPAAWPQDPRARVRALARQIDMGSLQRAFRKSYRVAKNDPGRYRAMSQFAREALKSYCSASVTAQRLNAIIHTSPQMRPDDNLFGRVPLRSIDYVLGSEVNFSKHYDARRYLFSGWSHLELGFGVWSDGDAAELAFQFDSVPAGPLQLRAKVNTFVNSRNS